MPKFENECPPGQHAPQNCVACQRRLFEKIPPGAEGVLLRIANGDCPACFSLTRAGSIALAQMYVEATGLGQTRQ